MRSPRFNAGRTQSSPRDAVVYGSRGRTCARQALHTSRCTPPRLHHAPARSGRARRGSGSLDPRSGSVPSGSSRNVRYQPSLLTVHERAKTRPPTTTHQTPMNRWSVRAPARTPMILLLSAAATTGREYRRATTAQDYSTSLDRRSRFLLCRNVVLVCRNTAESKGERR